MDRPQLWPIFICYRRADGSPVARRLHETLDQCSVKGPNDEPIILDSYLDETMPGVADWRELHRPYLERARALIVVCTPGLKIHEGPEDWVHRELAWWLAKRRVAPILIDPLLEGLRYVPDEIRRRWPEIQRIPLVEREWQGLPAAELERRVAALRRQIVGAIIPKGAEIYKQELEDERRRRRKLQVAFRASLVLVVALVAGLLYAYWQRAIAEASRLDARAAAQFAEARLVESRWDAERSRRDELSRALAGLAAGASPRRSNLEYEIRQLDERLGSLAEQAGTRRSAGNRSLEEADTKWALLPLFGLQADLRGRPEPPRVFSVELINAGRGESILVHYGTPDATFLAMINGGDQRGYRDFVEPRLRQLSRSRFRGAPAPIELFVAGDQDADKTEGLVKILEHLREVRDSSSAFVELRGVWANIFERAGRGLRPRIGQLIGELGLPLNEPFDHLVVRPSHGRASVDLRGGLTVVVLGPDLARLEALHRFAESRAEREGLEEAPLPTEGFAALRLDQRPEPLGAPHPPDGDGDPCLPNEHAEALAGGSYSDRSVANLASSVLLFRYEGRTFLHSGDSRGDLILSGLADAGLLEKGRAHVDLLHVPHLGSDHNVTREFFESVRADRYLFSGDGSFDNPEIATVASLIAARGCDRYTLFFVNRDGTGTHGAKLDAFFEKQQAHAPRYQRVFRAEDRGSVIVDLLDPVRY